MARVARMTVEKRFFQYVSPEPNTGCWFWTAYITPAGYGLFSIKGKTVRAHRASYLFFVGDIPEGLILDHLCRQPSCVNPDHLEAVTHRENTFRGDTTARRNAEKTHCIHGHEFTTENTDIRPTGQRRCKECNRTSSRERYRRLNNVTR